MMLWKCCTQYARKFGKLSSGHSFHSNPQERQCQRTLKLLHNCSNASKVMHKILQARLQQYVHVNFQMFRLNLEKAEEPSNCQHPIDNQKSKSSRKTSIFALLTTTKPLTVWITINCGKFWKRWEYQTTGPASWEIYMQVRKQQLELDMEQQTGSK